MIDFAPSSSSPLVEARDSHLRAAMEVSGVSAINSLKTRSQTAVSWRSVFFPFLVRTAVTSLPCIPLWFCLLAMIRPAEDKRRSTENVVVLSSPDASEKVLP